MTDETIEARSCACCGAILGCVICDADITPERRAYGRRTCSAEHQLLYRRQYIANHNRNASAALRDPGAEQAKGGAPRKHPDIKRGPLDVAPTMASPS